jgi:hypothetical protein
MNGKNEGEHKERIEKAMRRYLESQETGVRRRPLIRRKNNFIRGGMGIFCQHDKGADNGQ